MTSYFLRRLLLMIPTFIGITIMVFTVTRFVPGGPMEKVIMRMQMGTGKGDSGGTARQNQGNLTENDLEGLKKFYGFDKPGYIAYFDWLGKTVQLDLGRSTRYQDPVWELVKARIPVSAFYGLVTLLFTYGICIPLGIVKAIKHKSVMDTATSVVVFLGYAVPGYVIGIALVVFLASRSDIFPMGGFVSDNFSDLDFFGKVKDLIWHGILPCTTYLAGSFAVMTMLMKNSLLDNLASDYVRTAIAKGLPFKRAVFGHALRNSLIPIATSVGGSVMMLIGGSFLIEVVFNIDGMGLLGYESIVERDYPVVLGILVIDAVAYLLGNIISDFCVAFVDPRVQFS